MTETKSGYRTLENTGYGPKSDYRFPDVPPGAVVKFTLVDDLVSYWPLNEQSGQRNDVVGANHLTDNNTVGAVNRGPVGTAASFVAANGEYLTRDSSGLGVSAGVKKFSYAVWVKALAPTKKVIVQIGGYPGFTFDASGATISLTAQYYDGSGWHSTGGDSGVTSDVGWHLVVLEIDADTGGTLKVWMDGTQVGSSTATVALYDSSVVGSYIGYNGSYTDGHISGLGAWSRVLTAGERTSLFAAGNGKTYADLTTAEKVGLVSYWNLDEVSGTRVDSHGSNNLTDNNTVGSVNSGPSGVVARFVKADNEYLQAAENQTFLSDNTWSVGWWLKFDASKLTSNVPSQDIISAHVGAGNDLSFIVRYSYQADGHVPFTIYVGDGAAFDTPVNGYILNADANWHYFLLVRDGTSVKLYRDGSTSGYLSNASLAPIDASGTSSKVSSEAQPVRLGKSAGNGAADGFLSNVGIWSVAVASGEQTSLFNSGVGKRYADLTAGEKTGLVSYWDLSEASGTRIDSHGANDLTDNNTVGSVINAGGAMDGAAAVMAEANAESLSTAISVSGNFSVSMWLNEIVPGGFNIGFHDGATKAQFIASDASGSFIAAIGAVDESDLAAGTAGWNHVILEWDSVAETATIYVNNSTSASVVLTGGVPVISSFSIPFSDGTGGVFSADEVAIWSRVLTSDERAELYNAGAGFFYNATTEDFE